MRQILYFSLLLCLLWGSLPCVAQLTVVPQNSAAVLAQKLAGRGVAISNATLTCPLDAAATFLTANSNLGLDSGIVLTTGTSKTVSGFVGVNGTSANLASTNNGSPGDPQLTPLAGRPTFDACRLEFDFVPQGDSVQFDYVFSSEEYINSTCGPYNDVFAFFLSGPGITGTPNIARVPNTNIPVAVNSINSGIPGSTGNISNCTAMGPGSPFTAYYVDNATGTTITHRGFTTVLRAQQAVQPCGSYHLALTIADAGNATYDSGVFLKSGSLQAPSYKVDPIGARLPNSDTGVVKGCATGAFRVQRSSQSGPKTLRFVLAGNAVAGLDYQAVPDSITIPAGALFADVPVKGLPTAANGARTLKLFLKAANNCGAGFYADSATIILVDTPHLRAIPTDTLACAGGSFTLHAEGPAEFYYRWLPEAGLSSATSQNPVFTAGHSTTFSVTASLPGSGCPDRTAAVHVQVAIPPMVSVQGPNDVCTTGTVTLRAFVQPQTPGFWTGPNGFTSSDPQITITAGTTADSAYYVFRVPVPGCPSSGDSIFLRTHAGLPLPFVPPFGELCLNGQPATLQAQGFKIRWYPTATGGIGSTTPPTLQPTNEGIQTWYVTQSLPGCESDRARLDVPIIRCCAEEPFLPTAFTPNGDGTNDRWKPLPHPHQILEKVRIYDRWGRCVFVGYNYDSWDGTWSGEALPTGTYYYYAIVRCEGGSPFEFRGDITLIR